MAIINRTEAKNFLQITTDSYNDLIDTYIEIVEADIEAYINNKITPTAVTDEPLSVMRSNFDQHYVPNLDTTHPYPKAITKYSPIVTDSASSVTYDGDTLTADTDYKIDEDTGVITFYTNISDYKEKLVASYTAGYVTIPTDLKSVARFGVKEYFEQNAPAKQGGDNIKSKKIGNFSVTYGSKDTGGKAYLDANKNILNKYVRYGL
jgi:hypothetical protein